LINGQSQAHLLAVFNTFRSVTDTGFTVPYTIGCPPYTGNVANDINGVTIQTDADGIASTVINYPRTQLGRCFKLTAEANGGRVGAVMGKERLGSTVSGDPCTSWYLGVADGSTLTVIPASDQNASDQNLQVPVGESVTKTLTVQLFDGATPPAPLPAEKLSVQVVVTDPDHDAAIAAQNAVAAAQAVVSATIASNPANCSPTAPAEGTSEDARCTSWRDALVAAQDALTAAQADLAAATARDALHNPTATFTPNPLVTGTDGIAALTITVADLYTGASTGGDSDSKVEFFITTVGPEIRAETITITVSPQGAVTE